MLQLDIIGQMFSRLTILELSDVKDKQGRKLYKCICDCGNVIYRRFSVLKSGNTKSCGCLKIEKTKQRVKETFVDLTGKKFGRLTVLRYDGYRYRNETHKEGFWVCLCECGKEKIISRNRLIRKGPVKSCGCFRKQPRTPKASYGMNAVIRQCKLNAKKRKIVWDLTDEDVLQITKRDCDYCGLAPASVSRLYNSEFRPITEATIENSKYVYNGIDRIDNNLGYILENCVPCCTPCNLAKKAQKKEAFYDWTNRVYLHMKNTGLIK